MVKNFMGYFRTDWRRLWKSGAWLIGMAGVAASLLFSLKTNEYFAGHSMVNDYVFATDMAGFLIAYVFCAFPYAAAFSEDWEHKYIRYEIIRGNRKGYVLSKSAVIYVSSIAVMLGGTLLFLLLYRILFPWTEGNWDSYETFFAGSYGSVLKAGKQAGYCMLYALNLGLLSGMLSLFAAFCSIYISNRVLVLTTPVLLLDVLENINIHGNSAYIFHLPVSISGSDWADQMLRLSLSLFPAMLLTTGIYQGIKHKL